MPASRLCIFKTLVLTFNTLLPAMPKDAHALCSVQFKAAYLQFLNWLFIFFKLSAKDNPWTFVANLIVFNSFDILLHFLFIIQLCVCYLQLFNAYLYKPSLSRNIFAHADGGPRSICPDLEFCASKWAQLAKNVSKIVEYMLNSSNSRCGSQLLERFPQKCIH